MAASMNTPNAAENCIQSIAFLPWVRSERSRAVADDDAGRAGIAAMEDAAYGR